MSQYFILSNLLALSSYNENTMAKMFDSHYYCEILYLCQEEQYICEFLNVDVFLQFKY